MADKTIPFDAYGNKQLYKDNRDGTYSQGVQETSTDATGVVQPAGGTGVRGWLSGIYNLLFSGSAKITLSGSKTEDITFHDAAVAAADGTVFTVLGYKTLTVEIS